MHSCLIPIVLLLLATYAETLHILGVFPTRANSHASLGRALMLGLASRGHNVTLISPFPARPEDPFRVIHVSGFPKPVRHKLNSPSEDILTFTSNHLTASLRNTEHILQSPAIQSLLHHESTASFDIIVHECFGTEALLGFGRHFAAPIVAFSPIGDYQMTNAMVAAATEPAAYVAHISQPYADRMTFGQRIRNTLVTLGGQLFIYLCYMPAHSAIYERYFAGTGTTLRELQANVSMVLLNSHFALGSVRSYPPNMIEVGGIHLRSDAELAGQIAAGMQQFMDGAGQSPGGGGGEGGVVIFSMGSVLQANAMSAAQVNAICRAFRRLHETHGLRLLWKWEGDEDGDESSCSGPAIMRRSWIPQQAVLAHPQTRAFITHGGLLSCLEAVQHARPMIGIPIYGDQPHNVARAVAEGYAVRLAWSNVTEAALVWAVEELLDQPRYAHRVQAASRHLRDHPDGGPLWRAIYWIEYAPRTGGAGHLRSAAAELGWWTRNGWDVWASFAAIVGLGVYIARRLVCRRRRIKAKVS